MLSLDIEKVIKVVNDKEFISNANTIKVNDVIKVLPGEKIPTDGIIINGSSTINTSMLTGESKPLEVYVNDKVVSGCINNDGVLYIKALTTVDESTSSKVMKMIKEASKNKASSERFITKFAKYYTPIVILIALIVMFIIPMFIGFNEHFTNYLYKGLSIMVISCPCALVISIPLSYFMGIGKSARYSILVKGSSYIETLANIKAIAFDKTGTITKGNFKVTHIQSTDIKLMESLLYSCELNFTHPIATSIVNSLSNAEKLDVYDVKNIPGYGIKALYKSKEILIGNEKLLKDNNVLFDSVNSSLSIIYVSYNNLYLGYIIIEDELKDDAISSINDLSLNYQLHLISGDKKEIVNDIASKVNIKSVYYQQLPEDKVNVINNIKENNSVAYVGDGINDAACLLNASVGIAMKSLGSDIAIQASDIVIMDDKISSINKAIKISKKTMKTVITNIIMSILFTFLVPSYQSQAKSRRFVGS